jgi:hypothetical protein
MNNMKSSGRVNTHSQTHTHTQTQPPWTYYNLPFRPPDNTFRKLSVNFFFFFFFFSISSCLFMPRGWKHACAPTRAYIGLHADQASKILFVVTAKNPYSWLLSMWRHPYHYVGETVRRERENYYTPKYMDILLQI